MIENKKPFIALAIVGVMVFVGVLAVLVVNKAATNTPEVETVDTDVRSVSISNLLSYKEIDVAIRANIEDSLTRHVSELFPNKSATGVVRDGSYKTTHNEVGTNTVFLVDFPDLKISYKVSIGQGNTTDERSVYVICPAKSELLYEPFNCKDDLSGSIRE